MPELIDTEMIFEAAISAHERCQPDRAHKLCLEILQVDPDHLEALNLLAVILQDRGRAEEAISLLSRAVELDPEFSDAFANLARGLRLNGNEAQAVTTARRASQLDPNLGEAWLQQGLALISLKRYDEAIVALRQAVACLPDAMDPYVSLGFAAQMQMDHAAAAQAWRHVLRLRPDRIDALVNLGIALTELDQPDDAMMVLRRAVDRAPDDLAALTALANTLHKRCDATELVSVCRRILVIQPGRLDTLTMLAKARMWLGQFAEFQAALQLVREAHPDSSSLPQELGAMVPGILNQHEAERCRAQLRDPALSAQQRASAGFALGKMLDQRGEYDAAFEAFTIANGALRDSSKEDFDLSELQTYATFVRTVFSPPVFTALRTLGNPSDLPVFIVGMPRSGTSLVEQIAASHSRVFGSGERKDIFEAMVRVNGGRTFVSATQWNPVQVREEADNLITQMRARGGNVDRVIDKLPDNIQMLGQIRVLFPNARIIICRRDPRDVCFSCFTTHFAENFVWSHDLEECAARTVETDHLAEYWSSVLPGPILTIDYESLVENLEAESRRLIDFLGLDWEPGCLEFHKTERSVTTASVWQVRQPVYRDSIGRWRRYQAHLSPMLKILAGHISGEPELAAKRAANDPPASIGGGAEENRAPTQHTTCETHTPPVG